MEWREGVIPDCRHGSGKRLAVEELDGDEYKCNRLHKSSARGKMGGITDTESRTNDTDIWKDQCERNHVASERRDDRVSVGDGGSELQMVDGSCFYMPDRHVRNKVTNDEDLTLCFYSPITAPPAVDRYYKNVAILSFSFSGC